MLLAIWDYGPAEFLVSGFTSGTVVSPFEIERHSARRCDELLRAGQVDVALVPTLDVVKDPEFYDVLPAIALSTWRYPYARLVLKQDLGDPIRTVALDPAYTQEALLARILLKEHYAAEPEFVPYTGADVQALLEADEDASLIIGPRVPMVQTDRPTLDVGQEWYELSNYPMVWGLFAARKGEATPEMIIALRDAAEAAEASRAVWMQAQEPPPALHRFYQDDLRIRLDDLAVASLTEWLRFLFFYGIAEEIAGLPFVSLPGEDEEDDSDDELLA
ncbi:MAG: MqnA/MqnD/SBP family protein [Rhodothermales bacterium]